MKNQYAIIIGNDMFICERNDADGINVYYHDANPSMLIGVLDVSIPPIDSEDPEADQKFEQVVITFIEENFVMPIKVRNHTVISMLPKKFEPLTPYSQRNLNVIENFLLHYFAPCEGKDNTVYDEMMEAAKEYISEDHVDGEDSDEAQAQRARIQPLLEALEIVKNDPELAAEFSKVYHSNFDEMKIFILNDMYKPNARKLLLKLAERKKEDK